MNVIIYSENGKSELQALLEENEDLDVRTFPSDDVKDYKDYNPYVVIFDMDLDKLADMCTYWHRTRMWQ